MSIDNIFIIDIGFKLTNCSTWNRQTNRKPEALSHAPMDLQVIDAFRKMTRKLPQLIYLAGC